MSEKETVANWMIANGFSTGHGDSAADMLNELAWQINQRVDQRVDQRVARAIDAERVAFANLCNKNANDYLSESQNEAARAAVALAVLTLEKVRKND